MGYFGPILEKEIGTVRIGELRWINKDNLQWEPGKEIATIDQSHKPRITIVCGLKSQVFDETNIREFLLRIRNANHDLDLGSVIIPKESLNEVASEIEKRINLYF